MYFLLFLLLIVVLILIARPLTVFFHELGHAIPCMLLTGKQTTIYIGSYGDPKNSLKFSLGKLVIYFQYNPLLWTAGVCMPSAGKISLNREIIYIISGPIASLIIALICCFYTFTYDLHGFFKLFLLVFLGSALVDLITNLTPRNVPITMYDGTIAYNDGYQLKQIISYKRLPAYRQAIDLFNSAQYAAVIPILNKVITDGTKSERIYRLAFYCACHEKNYQTAIDWMEKYDTFHKRKGDDWAVLAYCYSGLGRHEEAIELYKKSLQENPKDATILNNIGYVLTVMERFEEAIPYLDKAIECDTNLAYAYNNRGLAKIKTARSEDGLKDINQAMDLDKDNAYVYRNLGIYHLDNENYHEALRLFNQAKEMDSATESIDELIEQVSGFVIHHSLKDPS